MEHNPNENNQPTPPRRRRKRSKWQNFKEAYLPVIIVALAVILIIVFIIGSLSRSDPGAETTPSDSSTEATVDQAAQLQQQAEALMAQADQLAQVYDYAGAIEVLTSFTGDMTTIPGMVEKYNQYSEEFSKLVPYTDMERITHLSVNVLIADINRALADGDYSSQFNRNYITTDEFTAILQELYDGGYMLVSLYDIGEKTVAEDGTAAITPGTLYLPEGKKPLVLTQTGGNYFTYMVDGDGDGLADKDGSGFASKLVLDGNGELTCEYVGTDGAIVTGALDFVPILNDFIDAHPDFSYHGARATLAVTGYDGLFGYRTDPETAQKLGQEFYDQQLADVKPVIEALKAEGYDFACYTYDLASYGEMTAEEIRSDLNLWTTEVEPLLGDVDILVYPYGSDIGSETEYSGAKYDVLKEFGFCYFIGQDSATRSWGQITDDYLRQTRRQITGALMAYSYSYYDDLFDATQILDPQRGTIPN